MGLSSSGGSPYRARVIADGASHYWRLGETSGTTAADEIGGSAPGTISGGVTLGQPGAFADGNLSMAFDGTGRIETTAPVAIPAVVTIEAWIKPAIVADYAAIFSSRFTAGGIALGIVPPFELFCYSDGATPGQANGPDVSANVWWHVVLVHTGATATFYVNGIGQSPVAQSRGAQTPKVAGIGANVGGSNAWKGVLDDVAIYPRALTPVEISAHYALRTATIPPPITQAYTWARSGIARSDATRSNYVLAWSTVDLIVRDGAGNITSRTDITLYIRHGSLSVTQALNDEADTCSFQIVPTAPPEAVPQVGQEIAIAWTPGDVLFQGVALVVQFDRRPMNESPWVSVQCQDAMWRFDARIVTYRFPAQSVTTSIAFLVQWFCNLRGDATNPYDFRTAFVQPNMPSIAALDVVNQRPSTVMRRLMAAVQGGFYIDGLDVHAWAGSLSEPQQTNPQPLTNDLATLKAFRLTQDATQLRKRVLVEGQRTTTLISYPDQSMFLGLPLAEASMFAPATGVDARYVTRIGTQWTYVNDPQVVARYGDNPPQTRTSVAFTPGQLDLVLEAMTILPPPRGWVRVAGQYAHYRSYSGTPLTAVWSIRLMETTYEYGVLTVPIAVGTAVEWVDAVMSIAPRGLGWYGTEGVTTPGEVNIRAQPMSADLVTLAEAERPFGTWPPLEGFVQDGRYSYAGAQARAEADLDAFSEPLVTADWETDDNNAQPGRQQVINLTGSSVIDPLSTTITITRVDISFPLRSQPPRRRCTGGDVKPSTFLDLVLTDDS